MRSGLILSSFLVLLPCLWPPAAADEVAIDQALRVEVGRLREVLGPAPGTVDTAARSLVEEIYERRGYVPIWGDAARIASLIRTLESAIDDGLDPADYGVERILAARSLPTADRPLPVREQAVLDLMLTDSLVRLAYHLHFGKANPAAVDPGWNFDKHIDGRDAATELQQVMDSSSVHDALRRGVPRGKRYRDMQAYLAHYRDLAAKGGWPSMPEGPTLRPGAADTRLEWLARRLMATGDLPDFDFLAAGADYNDVLQAGVRRFQERHGLDVDGIVGPLTLHALNVPVERRVDQIRVNLERARWRADESADERLVVNIPGFRATVVRGDDVVWSTKVIVGKPKSRTPQLRSELRQVIFNPTWTVPRSIATDELLPEIRRDPGYLARGNYDLFRGNGDAIDPFDVDWSRVTRSNFGFVLVQRAGPANTLGRLKFNFPNDYSVYLHDTPARHLFGRADRALSHGCMRVEKPLDLAMLLLGRDGWTRQSLEAAIDSGETRTVALSARLPLHVVYRTAEPDDSGAIRFYNDVYGLDDTILDALDAPPESVPVPASRQAFAPFDVH